MHYKNETEVFINLLGIKYGHVFIAELKQKCRLDNESDQENLKEALECSIGMLNQFVDLKISTLNALKIINPNNKYVLVDNDIYISESQIDDVACEVGMMMALLKKYK